MAGNIADMAALAAEGGNVHHEFRAQAAIGKAQVALFGTDLIDGNAGDGPVGGLCAGGLWQHQLLEVGDPVFVDLDAGEGFAQQYVANLYLLADAVLVQPAQLQTIYLQQALDCRPDPV